MSGLRRRTWVAHFSLGVAAAWSAGPAAAAADAPVVLVVGDSLSAEYGLKPGDGWVALLQKRLAEQKKPHRVVNASISGDTTAGGRSRLPAALRAHRPAIVIVELGGNDALRGLPLASTRDNLLAMARAVQDAAARLVVVGMQVPPNYGAAYGKEFVGLFEQVARQAHAGLVPFLLKGVADRADAMDWFQPDRIHPLAKAHPLMLDNVWPALRPLL
ncbi:arylesterase [Pelomonas aquatica]|jgi:acyl-CoA thioesterase-1|uniref:Arylesterase n=1 Tax=Pelomonas aquatica TaxID=431058 RepID=A0A9X4LL96_9BURK|nr:arylesterase [Pelomonas aquatica]MCY4755533.1 arylesterase [Pelomonas aquatica]MDG0862253.1 arylesterase [Pelomonas aquatica]